MTKKTSTSRPKPRRKRVEVNLDDETYQEALGKAGGDPSRLRAIIRSLIRVWASGEYHDPPDVMVDQEMKRARGGGRKKQKPKKG